MGADMLMAQVQVPRGLHDRDTSEGRDELLRRVDAMDDDALHRVADWTGEDGDDENRARVREAIDVFFEARRDVIASYGQLGTMIGSGGMSWGDSPTESFDDIGILEASGICEDPMPWVADAAKVTVTFDVNIRIHAIYDRLDHLPDGEGGDDEELELLRELRDLVNPFTAKED